MRQTVWSGRPQSCLFTSRLVPTSDDQPRLAHGNLNALAVTREFMMRR
jgi:hypothetical protein